MDALDFANFRKLIQITSGSCHTDPKKAADLSNLDFFVLLNISANLLQSITICHFLSVCSAFYHRAVELPMEQPGNWTLRYE